MAIRTRNNKYYIFGSIKNDDGSIYQYTKLAKNCSGKKEAKEYERLFKMQYQDIVASKGYINFSELAEEYIKSLVDVKSSTIKTYEDTIKIINKTIGKNKINLITKDMLKNFFRELEVEHSRNYVSKFYNVTKAIFDIAVIDNKISVNPMFGIKRKINKNEIKKVNDFWEVDEFKRFIEEVDNETMHAFFIFLFYMGVRKGEAAALTWQDVDFENNYVRINKTICQKTQGYSYEITAPKTKNSYRNVPMFKIVSDELKKLYKTHSNTTKFDKDYFVFGYNKPLYYDQPRKYMITILNKINKNLDNKDKLKQIRIHDFRHSHASWLINNMNTYNFTDFEIAKRLGDSVQMLHSTYAHQFKDGGMNIINSIEKKEHINNNNKDKGKYDELIELKKLVDLCVITQSDFDLEKKEILNNKNN